MLPFQSLCFILKLHRSYWIVHFYTSVIIKRVRHLKSSKYTHSSPSNRRQIHLQVKNEVLKYFLVRINVRLYPSQSQSLNLFMHIDFVCTLKSQKHYNRFHDLGALRIILLVRKWWWVFFKSLECVAFFKSPKRQENGWHRKYYLIYRIICCLNRYFTIRHLERCAGFIECMN